MQIPIKQATIDIIKGDIVQQDVDAIVNAANDMLADGGGVCGAIHRAAGREQLAAACRAIGGCPTGEARITPGFRLTARQIIHAVGPIYARYIPARAAALLASAYSASLALASSHKLRSVAFPSLSTGIYGYPVEEAAPVALRTITDFLAGATTLELVRFVLWDDATLGIYLEAAERMREEQKNRGT